MPQQMLTVTFPYPENNEMTSCPVWFIIDPMDIELDPEETRFTPTVRDVACMFDGPFFSRAEAMAHVEACEYSSRAKVYCKSGHRSPLYAAAFAGTPIGR